MSLAVEPTEALSLFGLTRQEAQLYLVLLAEGALSGYEAAKRAGISRSNAYAGLAALVDKGAAYLEDGAVPRYAPLEPQDLFRHRLRLLSDTALALAPLLPRPRGGFEGYLTIVGARNVEDRLITMVEGAQLRVYFALPGSLVDTLVPALGAAASRGIRITALTDRPLDVPGAVVYPTSPPGGQVRLIVDSTEVLTGDWDAPGAPSCLYSKQPALVALFKQALGNEIRLIELGETRRTE